MKIKVPSIASVVPMFFSSILVVLSVSCAGGETSQVEQRGEGVFFVQVFDCLVPVPRKFVLFTRHHSGSSLSEFKLLTIGLEESIHLSVSNFDPGFPGTEYDVVSEKNRNGLSIQKFRRHVRPGKEIAKIRDGKQELMVYGGSDELIDSLVRGCEANNYDESPLL